MMQSSRLTSAAHRIIASSLTTQTRGVILRSFSSSIGRTAAIHGGPNERSKLVEQERGPTMQMQQKRHYGVQERRATLDDVSCVGVDGYPKGSSSSSSTGDDQKRQEEEDKEYFKHHKASPLSEVELADTRKPVTQATDGSTATNSSGVITFKGEQLESAEETMMRAMRVWKEVAMKGDPDMPHSRALRDALRARGEYYDFEWELPADV